MPVLFDDREGDVRLRRDVPAGGLDTKMDGSISRATPWRSSASAHPAHAPRLGDGLAKEEDRLVPLDVDAAALEQEQAQLAIGRERLCSRVVVVRYE